MATATARRARARNLSLSALTSTIRFPNVLPSRTIATVEIVLSTSFCAVPVGPELVAGSTRQKAGTAQKLVLNTISTVTMIRLGKTFGNLMVDVDPANEKLRARARQAVELAAGVSADEAEAALAAAGGEAKVAIVALVAGVDAATARERLAAAGGAVRDALPNRT